MIVRNEVGHYEGIRCDSCTTMAPPPKEIQQGHGLNNMGWRCTGGSHVCPKCLEAKHV